MRLAEIGEFGLLKELGLFRAPVPPGWVGPGDDAAVLAVEAGKLLWTADLLIEDVHFRVATSAPGDLGWKTLAVNVSDLAAMGGRPLGFTLSLAAPGSVAVAWVRAFYEGLSAAAEAFGCPLLGGDTSSGPKVFLSVAALGRAAPAGPVLRSGARPGDDLYVSGAPGESAMGLRLLEAGAPETGGPLAKRHLRPAPRMALGAAVGDAGLASAMIDVSDGVLQDLGHVLEASRAGAVLRAADVPISAALAAAAKEQGLDPLALALTGGEDYELLLAAPPGAREHLLAAAEACRTPIARIGRVEAEPGVRWEGPAPPLTAAGFDHFRR